MSFAELKREVEQLTPEQRQEIAVLLSRLMDSEDEEQLSTELARRHASMDAGLAARLFERMAASPHARGDTQIRDRTGRENEVAVFRTMGGDFLVRRSSERAENRSAR